jgi:predicted dehydrogenase
VLGEACHFVDYACFLMASPPVRVTAEPLGPVHGRLAFVDGFSAQVAFADGSCAQLVYAPEASAGWPKEVFTVFASGFAVEVTNFQQMVLHRRRAQRVLRFGSKGHAEEMAAWIEYLQARAPHPLDYAAARQSMHVTFAVLESIQQGRPIEL